MSGSCEYDNKLLWNLKGREFIRNLNDYQLFKVIHFNGNCKFYKGKGKSKVVSVL
jgi:hypothetical protein